MRHLVSDSLARSRLYGTRASVLIVVLGNRLSGPEYDVGYLVSSIRVSRIGMSEAQDHRTGVCERDR